MTNIEIIDSTYTSVTRESDPDDRWDCDDTDTIHNISGFKVKNDKEYFDLTVGFEPDYDKTYFLLYATYSTGCSFCSSGGEIVFIDLYQDREIATANLKILEADEESFSNKISHESGKEYDFHKPWIGYFESLENIEVIAINRR